MKAPCLLLICSMFLQLLCFGDPLNPNAVVHVIAIGIDDYSNTEFSTKFEACVSDAKKVTHKFVCDFEDFSEPLPPTIYTYDLFNKHATYNDIKLAFSQVARTSQEHDYVIVFFAGLIKNGIDRTYLIPYDSKNSQQKWIEVSQLASWMEGIAAKNQLIISEAGAGSEFAMDLINKLFEQNSMISSEFKRNRLILTTHETGFEGNSCGENYGGYLVKFLLGVPNAIQIFHTPDKFERELIEQELQCDRFNKYIYCKLYQENEYRLLIQRQNTVHRKGVLMNIPSNNTQLPEKGRNVALLISTSLYPFASSIWPELKNPHADANALSEVLQRRYDFETKQLKDKPMDSILQSLIELKRELRPDDKVILFFAGHGLYDVDHSDGFLVFSDAVSPEQDPHFQTYLQMSKLNTLVNSFPCRQLFLIFDVCFGSSFDLLSEDLAIVDYSHLSLDLPLDVFIDQKDQQYTSRIFLASGRGIVPDFWDNNLDHSPFASKLLFALEHEQEFISPGKIYRHVEGNVTEPVLKQFGLHQARADFLIPVTRP